MKTIKLLIDDQTKTFTIPFISGMVLRKYLELKDTFEDESNLTVAEIDKMVDLVVYAYGNKFTAEEFYNGIPFDKLMTTINSLFIPESKEGETENEKK